MQTIVNIVQKNYKGKDYCIITPYDAQRNELEKALKRQKLRSDNVFNVDSFQGTFFFVLGVTFSNLHGQYWQGMKLTTLSFRSLERVLRVS